MFLPSFDVGCGDGADHYRQAKVSVCMSHDDDIAVTFDEAAEVRMTQAQWWALVEAVKDWLKDADEPAPPT